jgi:hypothetical protein
MPAQSKAQRQAMAIAEHSPEKSYYPSMTKMKQKDLHDFAATKEKGLPKHKRHKKSPKRGAKR